MEQLDHQTQKELASSLIIGVGALVLFVIHAFFLAYYLILGFTAMAVYNFASTALYIVIFRISYRRRDIASLLVIIEIAIFCMFSAYFIGWSAGTHHYLPVMIFPCFQMFNLSRRRALYYTCILTLSMLICYVVGMKFQPFYYGHTQLRVILVVNLFICMAGAVILVLVQDITNKFTEEYYRSRIDGLTDEVNKDALTKLWNRRYIDTHMVPKFADEAFRKRTYMAMVDIDFFKNVNDSYGHEVGDQALVYLASLIRQSFRSTDVAARWGGEEFLIILDTADAAGAYHALESFRNQLASSELIAGGQLLRMTVTIGFAWCGDSVSFQQCIEKSDAALYYGKRNRRDIVVDYNLMKPSGSELQK